MRAPSHRKVLIITGVVAVVMFLFCFAMVPFYNLICRKTGINTEVPGPELLSATQTQTNAIDKTRTVLIELLTTNHLSLPWEFYPRQKFVMVHPGQTVKVMFYAHNQTAHDMTVQAIPSMTPVDAISHFHKAHCFCFTQQSLKAGESKDLALIFTVDTNLPKTVRVITLAYTLFDLAPLKKNRSTRHDG